MSFRKHPIRGYCIIKFTQLSLVYPPPPPWKLRYGNHKLSSNKRYYAKCEIAKEVWRIKDQGGDLNIEWRIIGHAPAYNQIAKKCNLCIAEKVSIAENMDNEHPNLINKRDELINKCLPYFV